MPYQYEPYELQLLGSFLHTGAQAAGTVWRPTALSGLAELDSHQVGEVVYAEIVPPVTALGVVEDLEQVKLVLDDKEYGNYIHLMGTDTHNVCPPKPAIMNGQLLAFGTPLVNAMKGAAPILEATCPKFVKSVKVEATAGVSGITANYLIRFWGYRYPEQELQRLFPQPFGGSFQINDERFNRVLSSYKQPKTVSWDTWTQLSGGLDQAMPKVNPMIRYARNLLATTPSTRFQFRYETGAVALREENLYFPFDIEDKALLIRGLGVRTTSANLAQLFINIDGKDRPYSRFPTTQFLNDFIFGSVAPILPAALSMYFTVPKLDRPYLIWKDKGYVGVVDGGAAAAIGSVVAMMNGIYIEMG